MAKAVRVKPVFDLKPFLAKAGPGRTVAGFRRKDTLFAQGEPAETVLYLLKGRVKLTVVSQQGKEAVIAMLGPDDFLGEGSLAGQRLRMATATATTDGSVLTLTKKTVTRLLHDEPKFSELFVAYLLVRNVRIEEDLVDQLFNSSEKRLARILLLLSRVGSAKDDATPIPKVSQETLAEMIGTTRERVN
jgi:CRP-like cAMP-binding protein